MEEDFVMYILVNKDIKIGKGKLAGQVGHAVASFFYHYVIPNYLDCQDILHKYMKVQKKIILKCPQDKLEELEREGYLAIRDKGLTQLQPNTLTCINLGIYDRNDMSDCPELEFVRDLPLY